MIDDGPLSSLPLSGEPTTATTGGTTFTRGSGPNPTMQFRPFRQGDTVAAGSFIALTGVAILKTIALGAMLGAAALSGTAHATTVTTGQTIGAIPVSGGSVVTTTSTGQLGGGVSLAGGAVFETTAGGQITGAGASSGAAVFVTTATGQALSSASLSGASIFGTTPTGQILGSGALSGTAVSSYPSVGQTTGAAAASGTAVATTTGIGSTAQLTSITGTAIISTVTTGDAQGASGSVTPSPYLEFGAGGGGGGFHKKPPKRHKHVHIDRILDEVVAEVMYKDLIDTPHAKAAGKIVKVASSEKVAVPAPDTVDWGMVEKDAKKVAQLLALWQEQQIDEDDEDWWLLD